MLCFLDHNMISNNPYSPDGFRYRNQEILMNINRIEIGVEHPLIRNGSPINVESNRISFIKLLLMFFFRKVLMLYLSKHLGNGRRSVVSI